MNKKLFIIAIALLISTILFGQTSGGPDSFGYSWINSNDANGPVYSWITPNTANATQITGMRDTSTHPVPLGINFNFYGTTYDSVNVSSDGILYFSGTSSLSNQDMPDTSNPNNLIAWFWDDMNPGFDTLATQVYYENITFDGGNAFLISFIDYYEYLYGGGGKLTAQVILTESGNIYIQYNNIDNVIDRDGCSVGIENADGTSGLTYCYNDGANLSDNLVIKFYTIEAGHPDFAQNPQPLDGAEGIPVNGSLTWDFGVDTDTYDLWFGPAGNMTEVVTGAAAGATGSYTYSGLTESTDYEWKIVTHNSNTRFTTEGAVWSFRTQAGAISTFPWAEDFTNWPPVDWTFAGDRDWAQHSASSSAYCNFWGWNGGVAQMITPPIAVPATGNYSLMFDWSSFYNSSYDNDSLAVLISTDGSNWTQVFSEIGTGLDSNDGATNTAPGSFVTANYDLSAFSGQTILVNFYARSGWGPNIFIDNVAVMDMANPPACTSRIAPSDTSAVYEFGTLNWNSAQLATSYKVYLGSATGNYDIMNDIVVDSTSLDYSGLAYNTQYFWKVVPQNASGEATGCPEWTFTTRNDPTVTNFPYIVDFESGIPEAWMHDETAPDVWTIATSISYAADSDHTSGSGNLLAFDDSGTGQDTATITTAPFDITGLTNPTFNFFFWNGDIDEADEAQSTISIDIYSNGTWNNGIASYGYTPVWSQNAIDLSSFSSDDLLIRINAIGTDSFYGDIAIDDISVYDNSAAPGCTNAIAPVDMAVDAIENGTLSWSSMTGSTGYKVSLGTDNPPTDIVNMLDVSNALTYDFTGLNYNTTYYWMVTPYNASGDASNCPVWSFTTRQDPTISAFPWTEDFENGIPATWISDENAPDVWEIETTLTYAADVDHSTGSGSFLGFDDSGTGQDSANVITNPFDITGLTNPSLSFFFWNGDADQSAQDQSTLTIDVLSNGTWNNSVASYGYNSSWTEASIDLTPYSSNNVSIRFNAIGTTSYYGDIAIDDVTIYDNVTAPGCANIVSPADAAVDIIEVGTLSWAGATGATGYTVSLGTDNPPTDVINMQDVSNALTYDYTGLNYGTTYYWMVIPYNANGTAANCPVWSFTTRADPTVNTFPYVEDFETAAVPVNWIDDENNSDPWSYGVSTPSSDTGPQNGDHTSGTGNFMFTESSGNLNQVFKMKTNPFDVSGLTTPTLDLWYHMYGQSMGTLQVNLIETTTGNVINDIIPQVSGDQGDVWMNASADLSAYSANPFMIEIVATTGDNYYSDICIDDFAIYDNSTVPVCTVPSSPVDGADFVLEDGTLTWNAAQGATGYKFSFGTDNPPTNIADNQDLNNVVNYDFTGLSIGTVYYWSVTPYNAIGDAVNCPVWSFTTRPDPTVVNFPWTEDFSSFPLEPRGWSYGGTRTWEEHPASGSIYCRLWNWSDGNAELLSPEIALTGNADLLFKWSHHYNDSYPNDAFEVSVSTDQTNWNVVWSISGDQFESNDGADNTNPGSFVQETINIDQYSGQTIYLKFDGISGYGPNLFLDDVGINITTPPDDDLTAITVIGNTTPMVGSPTDYVVSVRNNGLNDQSVFDVKLILAPNTELGTVPGTAISNNQINDYVITWTPQAGMEGPQNIFGRVVLANDENPANDDSAMLPVDVQESQTGIQGYVRDINGNPLFNAQILIEELQVVQYTGNNGFYQFLNVPVGTYSCTATINDYDDNTQTGIIVTQDVLTNVDFTMTQGSVLRGVVYDQNNNVVDGATVEIAELTLSTVTDDQGAYTFVQVTPGTYTVNASKDGYIDVSETNVVIAADTVVDLDLVLNEYGHLTVNITTNLNSPAGAVVELTDGTNTYTETSDDTGVVLLNEVLPGTYSLTASMADCNTHEQANIVIVNGDNTPIDVTLNEELIAPTNVTWHSDQGGYLSWSHGDRLFDTRGNNDDVLAGGQGYNDKNSQNGNDERQLINFRVEIDLFNQTTQDTFLTVTGFEDNEALTAIVTAVYETGTASAPAYDFNFVVGNDDEDNASLITELKGNYPNPFNPTTNIEFSLKKSGNVELVIYNITGQKVRTLVSGDMEADTHRITWNGKDDRGNTVSSGTYFYRLQTSEYTKTRKMLMLK